MKNILFVLFFILLLVCISNFMTTEDLIPEDAIRIRVVGSSNKIEDQELKMEIKEDLEEYLYSKLNSINNIKDADIVIQSSINEVKNIVEKYTSDYTLNYGDNYFPEKEYKGVKYKDGNYKSLVITLGNGLGDNWWCVLFPPLCMIDSNDKNDVEYRSYVVDLLSRYK